MQPAVSEPAREAFLRGFDETRRLSHASVRAEHILLGVLHLSAGSASAALDATGVERAAWRRQLEKLLPPPEEAAHEGEYPYHPSGAALLGKLFAPDPADSAQRITSGRVLLELLRLERSFIGEATAKAGVDRASLLERLSADPDDSE